MRAAWNESNRIVLQVLLVPALPRTSIINGAASTEEQR